MVRPRLMSLVSKNLVTQEPSSEGRRLAAVAMIVKDRDSPSILLIKRAERIGDPWSGQIAFPGGKMQEEDRTARDTAVRETREEVGFDLTGVSEFLGYGGVATTHTGGMDVVPAVFELRHEVDVRPNGEVASFRWVELGDLVAPKSRSTYILKFEGKSVELPALTSGDYVVWGLTHRILTSLLQDDQEGRRTTTSPRRTPVSR